MGRYFPILVVLTFAVMAAPSAMADCSNNSCFAASINSNFNGTAIPGNDTIWFNSVIKPGSIPATGATVFFDNQTISFSSGNTNYNLAVPNTQIDFYASGNPCSGGASSCTTFDNATNSWITYQPVSATGNGNTFLSGLAFQVPASGLPGGIGSVTWSGDFNANPSLGLSWQWAAAAYSNFGADCSGTNAATCTGDYNSLGVKPIDANSGSIYANSDHAGTPEYFTKYVIGGARGGGGANYTGSYSGTQSFTAPPGGPPVNPIPEPGTFILIGTGAAAAIRKIVKK
ncbi:MAG: PEP-CTERM sorting domain-containing protein [Acidobacteria bacterium]|nr:PEP-CTERM sorting domain-containing protein [Acidobacteriota bacterium]